MIPTRPRATAIAIAVAALLVVPTTAAYAEDSASISGEGSTWAQNAVDLWRRDVAAAPGLTVFYAGVGSAAAVSDLAAERVDFAVTDIPLGDGASTNVPSVPHASVPVVAGGIAFAYDLVVDGRPFRDLRLSGDAVAGIFSGVITRWDDPLLRADNPGVALPAQDITPVVRADAAATSLGLTRWMQSEHSDVWSLGASTVFPAVGPAFRARNGSLGVVGDLAQSYGRGAITYVENASAVGAGLPTAKILNTAGYYVAPTPEAVSIALGGATPDAIGTGVWRHPDARAYPLATVSSAIVPTQPTRVFTAEKGRTLSQFLEHALCRGQQDAAGLGNAPLPLGLVQSAAGVLAAIPGSAGGIDLATCANPTFVPGDSAVDNVLLRSTPMPPDSDKRMPSGSEGSTGTDIDVTVTASDLFQLTAPTATSIDFGDLGRGRDGVARTLGRFTVVDDRNRLAGWSMQITVSDFIGTGDPAPRFSSSALGIDPREVVHHDGVVVAPSQEAGRAVYPMTLASAAPGTTTTLEGATFDADLTLRVPRDAAVGDYRSTVTLTLIAR